MKHAWFYALSAAAVLWSPAPFAADDGAISDTEMVRVQVVDFSGKPPFRRVMRDMPVSNVARLEVSDDPNAQTVVVRDIDRSGAPPFKRRLKEVPVVDVARFELGDDETQTRRRKFSGAPPFRRF